MAPVARPRGDVSIWSQVERRDDKTFMLADGMVVEDSWLRAGIVARASQISLRGRPTVVGDQTAYGLRGWSTLDFQMTTLDGSRISLGFLVSSRAATTLATLFDDYLIKADLTMDVESHRQSARAEQALRLASRPGCLGALT